MPRSRLLPTLCLLALLAVVAGCGGKSYDPSLQLANFNLGEVLDGFMMRAQQAMRQVRDLDSARAAARELQLVNSDLADLVYNAQRLTEEGRIELGELAAEHLVQVERLAFEIDRSPVLAEVFDEELADMTGYLQVLVSGRYEDLPAP